MAGKGDGLQRTVFIVRLDRDPLGQVSRVVERVRTGEKARVGTVEEVSVVLDDDGPGRERARPGPSIARDRRPDAGSSGAGRRREEERVCRLSGAGGKT